MATYEREEVERVILAFYNGQNVVEANAWLTSFVASQAAWEISLNMIHSSPHMQVRFFAANALHQKIVAREIVELPPEAQAQLLSSLLSALHTDECSQKEILVKLSLALVALGLFFTKEEGKLKAMLLDNPAFLALRPRAALEFFLLLPQEWENAQQSMTRSAETRALQQLALLLPQVVSLIQSLLSSAEDQDMLSRSLRALAGWCKFGISISTLRTLPFYASVKELTASPTLSKPACELFVAAIKNTSYPSEPDETLLEIVDMLIALQPRYMEAASQRNDDFCEGLASLACALVQRNGELMASGRGATLHLAHFTLEMIAHPHKGISETAMEYWDDVELVDMSHRHEALRGPIFHLLIEVLATRCAPYPAGFVDWDSCDGEFGEDEFKMFRRRIEDSLLNCCVGLRAEALATLCRLLAASSQGRWEGVEALLFAIACVGPELTTLQEPDMQGMPAEERAARLAELRSQRQLVYTSISELLSNYIFAGAVPRAPSSLAHRAALRVLQNYSKCLPQNPALVHPALGFIVGQLLDGSTAEAAAKALETVCALASHPSVSPVMSSPAVVSGLLEQVSPHFGGLPRGVVHSVVESVGRLIAALSSPQHRLPLLEQLITPILARLRALVGGPPAEFVRANVITEVGGDMREPSGRLKVAACVSLVGSAVRFLECEQGGGGGGEAGSGAAAAEKHPAMVVLEVSWEALDAAIAKFPGDPTIADALCETYSKSLKQGKEATGALLPALLTSLVGIFRGTRADKCLEVAGTVVEIFGRVEGSVSTCLQTLLREMSAVIFEAAQTLGLDALPELLEGFFTLLTRYLVYCPAVLLTSPELPTVLELAKAGIPLRNKEPLRAVMTLWQDLVSAGDSAAFDAYLAPWFRANGQALVLALVLALADTAAVEVTRMRMPVLFYNLNARFGAEYQGWLRLALTHPSFSHIPVDQAAKDQFLQAHVNVEHSKPRFQMLLQDFADICRSSKTADALLAYQLA